MIKKCKFNTEFTFTISLPLAWAVGCGWLGDWPNLGNAGEVGHEAVRPTSHASVIFALFLCIMVNLTDISSQPNPLTVNDVLLHVSPVLYRFLASHGATAGAGGGHELTLLPEDKVFANSIFLLTLPVGIALPRPPSHVCHLLSDLSCVAVLSLLENMFIKIKNSIR